MFTCTSIHPPGSSADQWLGNTGLNDPVLNLKIFSVDPSSLTCSDQLHHFAFLLPALLFNICQKKYTFICGGSNVEECKKYVNLK